MSCYQDNPLITPEAFQQLIQDHTNERKRKVHEKRQDGLRRIAEMKSKSGVHPLNLFPKEIWLQILNEGSPEDKWKASQVHPLFQNLMESGRIQDIILPQAMKVVLDYVKNNEKGSMSKLRLFIKLRQVSKSVKYAVDRWFDEKYEEELFESYANPAPGVMKMPRRVLDLRGHYDLIPRLIENFNGDSLTTIPVRSIEVIIKPSYDSWEDGLTFFNFKSGIAKLLGLVGDQILYFKLKVIQLDWLHYVKDITVADYYLFLHELCELMPNLRGLEICLGARQDVNKVPRSLENLIQANPFPTLSNLVRMEWQREDDLCGEIPGAIKIIDAIIKGNPQIKMFYIDIENCLLEKLKKKPLKALSLNGFSWYNSGMSSRVLPTILNSNRWPLTDLNLFVEVFSNIKDMFQFLMKFPTLQKVWMFASDHTIIGKDLEFLNLPNLMAFGGRICGKIDYERDDVNFLYSLQFLVYSKKLKSIDWDYSVGEKEGKVLKEYLEKHECPENMIDFRGGMRDLNFSNIWNVFPDLETVEVTVPKIHNEECEDEYCRLHKYYHRPCKMLL